MPQAAWLSATVFKGRGVSVRQERALALWSRSRGVCELPARCVCADGSECEAGEGPGFLELEQSCL